MINLKRDSNPLSVKFNMKSNELEDYFNNTYSISSYQLKLKLFESNLKDKRCEVCNITEWGGKLAPLELHHKNGQSKDNSFENLQIICPNCHAQTHNYRASNQKRVAMKKSEEEIIEVIKDSYNSRQALIKLGYNPQGGNYNRINQIRRKHNIDFRIMTEEEKKENNDIYRNLNPIAKINKKKGCEKNRKVERPNKDEFLNLIWNNPVSSVAKNYNLSDNAIRKWAISYQIPVPPVGYWAKYNNGHLEECNKIKEDLFREYNII